MKGKIICGIVGLVVGTVCGYFIGGMNCAKHYKTMIEELEEEKDILENELKECEEEQKPGISSEKLTDAVNDVARKYNIYTGLANKYNEIPADNKQTDIHIISSDDFRKDVNYRDNETFTYYQEDGVLVDSADMPVHNEEETIGVEALDKLADTDEDFLYVDNDIEDKMYEIIVEHNVSYYRDLMGVEM